MTDESKDPLQAELIKHLTPPGVVARFQDEYTRASGGAPDSDTPVSRSHALTNYSLVAGALAGVELDPAAAAWEPGTPVRVVGQHYLYRGRVGVVTKTPLMGNASRVYVALYKGGRLPPAWRMRHRLLAPSCVDSCPVAPDQIEAVAWDATDEEKSDA